MAFLRHLLGRRWTRAAVASTLPDALAAPSAGAPPSTRQRQYLDDVPYLLPKDPLEDQRLNYQHHALYRTLSNHSLAPLAPERTRTILDVGTGTGIWAFEMQALFPHALCSTASPASAASSASSWPSCAGWARSCRQQADGPPRSRSPRGPSLL
ncbi:class I SAM-dependent methyltransferase [Thermogemmatispora tikiterensis]|uniref:Methyltransferase domain-containing protein n=1 Tax=Thermogemmatispora tikiterensis TaxID=1825093 RepID=A0A328VG65_9CHLR|nr:hypothetical protein [Thermogemmatispora tikiterensis]RAQ95831.1 hypothetical protein A4R35_09810 [Thermogemmatispora tikiterensis]